MLKKLLTACAGIVLTGGMALGVDVSGVYSAGAEGQGLRLTLNSQDGVVRGEVAFHGRTLPLVGRENNGSIQGVWRTEDGQEIPFAASARSGGMDIQTNGMTYSLSGGSAVNQQPAGRQAVEMTPGNAGQAAAAPDVQLEVRRGRVMECEVPVGWKFSENANGVDVSSPNGRVQMSHTFVRAVGRATPDSYLQMTMRQSAQYSGVANVQTLSVKELSPGTKIYEMEYTVFGQPVHTIFQIGIRPGPEGYIAELIRFQTAPELFQQWQPTMISMAKSVRVLDGNAFCANGVMNGEIRKQNNIRTQTIQDVAAIRNAGVAHQNHVRDEINQSSDDYIRSQSRFDDKNGNQYIAPLQAERMFKHDDRSVTYTTNMGAAVPDGAVELTPHRLAGR